MGLWVSRWPNHKTACWVLTFTMLLGWCLSSPPSFAQTALAASPPTGVAAPPPEFSASARAARLTLRVYNYAAVDSASLVSSEKVADKIFRAVGLESVWVDCPTSVRNVRAFASCDTPMGPADFVLRILPRRMADKVRHSQDSLGFAQICPASEPACELNLFYHRIDELAAKGYRADRILGYAITHEVAHILLGPAHSDDGIMRASWSSFDLNHISLGLQLGFSPKQSTELRLALLRRSAPSAPDVLAQANRIAPVSKSEY